MATKTVYSVAVLLLLSSTYAVALVVASHAFTHSNIPTLISPLLLFQMRVNTQL